jgi:hypothetical protein
MDGCRDVPPGSLVRMFTLFAQNEVQLARLDDVVECRALHRFRCGACPEIPHRFLWQSRPETPHMERPSKFPTPLTQHPPYRRDILSRLPPSSESNECHFSCGSRGLAKCWRLAPILPGRLAYILPIFSTNTVEGSIKLFPPEGAMLKSTIGALYCLGEALNTIRKAYDRTRTQGAHRPAIHTISHKTQCGRARYL